MNTRRSWFASCALVAGFAAVACDAGSSSGGAAGAPAAGSPAAGPAAGTSGASATAPSPADMPSVAQLAAWQAEIDGFDGGYRPTASPAHEGFIQLLVKHLVDLGVDDVHTEPYVFEKWTPKTWSLAIGSGPAKTPVALTGYVPYSGLTGASGVTAPLVYVSTKELASAIGPDGAPDPAAIAAKIAPALAASIASAGGVTGKIVVFDVPALTLPLRTITGTEVAYANDPTGALGASATVSRVELSTMLLVPAILKTLAGSGAVGAIGAIDAPEPIARGHYAPFFGILDGAVPAVYVDRATGASLKKTIADGWPLAAATLALDASLATTTTENIVGVVPGATDREILLSSHTDGPNALEDNGPVGILALASDYLKRARSARPRTLRVVLTGGHFVGSTGILTWFAAHEAELLAKALAVIELEHLGAREWSESPSGAMALTGAPEAQLLYVSSNALLRDQAIAFAKGFPRALVAGSMPFGEGQHYRGIPLVQFITMPSYLLSGHLPDITSKLTDFTLMRSQLLAFVRMIDAFAAAPADQLGPASLL